MNKEALKILDTIKENKQTTWQYDVFLNLLLCKFSKKEAFKACKIYDQFLMAKGIDALDIEEGFDSEDLYFKFIEKYNIQMDQNFHFDELANIFKSELDMLDENSLYFLWVDQEYLKALGAIDNLEEILFN